MEATLTPAAAFELAPGVALAQAAAFAGGDLWVHTWRVAERWELESGRRTAVLEDVDLLAPCDGSGDTVALVQGGRLITLRDGGEVQTIPLEGPLTALTCAQDGARMAGAGREGGVTLWDEGIARPGPDIAALEALETTQRRRQKKSTAADDGRGGPAEERTALRVRTLALSPDGGRLLLTLDDQSARTWDLATGQLELSLAAAQGRAVEAAFEAGSDAILVLEATAGKLRRLRPGAARPERVGDPGAGYAALKMAFHARSLGRDPPPAQRVGWHIPVLAVRPDGRLLAAADPEDGIGVWDTLTGERLRSLAGPLTQEGITLSGDGRWLLATTPGGRRWLWDLETATLRWTRAALADRVAFLPGEAGLVAAVQGALARIDLDGTVTDLLDDPEAGRISALVADGVSTRVAVRRGRRLRVLDAAAGGVLAEIERSTAGPAAQPFHPGERWLLRADGAALDLSTGAVLPAGPDLTAPAWHPSRALYAAVRGAGAVLLVDVARGGVQDALAHPAHAPRRLAFTPDGRGLVGIAEGYLLRWTLPEGALVEREEPGLSAHRDVNTRCQAVCALSGTRAVVTIGAQHTLWRPEPIATLGVHGATLAESCDVLALYGPRGSV